MLGGVRGSGFKGAERGSSPVPLVVLLCAMLPPAQAVLGSHEVLGMPLKLAANFRVRRQVLIETWMRRPELRVVYQLWILSELLSHLRMLIKVAVVEVSHRSSSPACLPGTVAVPPRPPGARSLTTTMPLITTLFRPHELPGIVIKLFPNSRVTGKETLQTRMSAVEIGIFGELGIRG